MNPAPPSNPALAILSTRVTVVDPDSYKSCWYYVFALTNICTIDKLKVVEVLNGLLEVLQLRPVQ